MKRLDELGISPAPWDFQPNNPAGPTVTDKYNWYVCGNWDMNKANARLIAAAPELYEALEDCLFQLDAWVHGGRFAITESDLNAIAKAENALAKAGEAK